MLTPVTAIASSSSSLKAHATSTNLGAGHSPVLLPSAVAPQLGAEQIAMDMPAGNLMASVNAVAATAGARTVLQGLALNVATLLNLTRRNDETISALFQRIAAAIDNLSPTDRLQIEMRSGLKAMKISLSDLSAALKNPDGAIAARLTAMAEAPFATPGKTAANAATGTYLLDGTGVAQAAETLAMRTAARANAAGYGLFSPDTKHPEPANPAADARVLQTQLKTLFEPGDVENSAEQVQTDKQAAAQPLAANKDAGSTAQAVEASLPELVAEQVADIAEPVADPTPEAESPQISLQPGVADTEVEAVLKQAIDAARQSIEQQAIDIGSPALDVGGTDADPLAGAVLPEIPEELLAALEEDIPAEATDAMAKKPSVPAGSREFVQAGLERLRETKKDIVAERVLDDKKTSEKVEQNDRRVQTILTLKGFTEIISALPGKAADILAPLVDKGSLAGDPLKMPNPADLLAGHPRLAEDEIAAARNPQAAALRQVATDATGREALASVLLEEEVAEEPQKAAARRQGHAAADEAVAMDDSRAAVLKSAFGQEIIPFAYAPVQPAREEFRAKRKDDDEAANQSDEQHQDSKDDDADDASERRSRDEYDAMREDQPEAEPLMKVTRDSSESDRAFALYQRMGGF